MAADPTEAATRKNLIDPALAKAGWDLTDPHQVGQEIPIDGLDPATWQQTLQLLKTEGYTVAGLLPKGIADYLLYAENGEVLAVVEAKRTSTDSHLADAQARFYALEIEKRQSFRPFVFTTNGHTIQFWDGESHSRDVNGFYAREDLARLLYMRQNRLPFESVPINNAITDRPYQHEAVRRVAEAFEAGKRRALLVMATGTGKTRTAMALVDLFLKANQARHILFVADRVALVDQALSEGFTAHIPNEPNTRIYTHDIDTTNRLYVSTLQTLGGCQVLKSVYKRNRLDSA